MKRMRLTSFEDVVCVQLVCHGDVVRPPERQVHAVGAGAIGHNSFPGHHRLLRGVHHVILPGHYHLLPGHHVDKVRNHVLVGHRVGVGPLPVYHLTDSCQHKKKQESYSGSRGWVRSGK